MIEIRNITGKVLELTNKDSITIELLSTLFSEDDILPGSRSLPIAVAMTEANQQFFEGKFRYYTDNFTDISVSLTMMGQTQYNCLLGYRVRSSRIEAFLKIDLGELASRIKKTKIADTINEKFSIGTTTAARNAALKTMATAEPGTYPVTFFPVKNELFFENGYVRPAETGFAYGYIKYLNHWDLATQAFQSDETLSIPVIGTPFTTKLLGYPIVPFVYVRYTIEQVCLFLGLKAVGAWLDEYETRRAVWDNNIAIYCDMVIGKLLFNSTPSVADYVPDLTIAEFFKAIRAYFGVGIFVNNLLKEVLFKTANTPQSGTVQLYIEGWRLVPGAGNDYTISGANITMGVAPLTGERLFADYIK